MYPWLYKHIKKAHTRTLIIQIIIQQTDGVLTPIVSEEITDVPLPRFYIAIMFIKKGPKENITTK